MQSPHYGFSRQTDRSISFLARSFLEYAVFFLDEDVWGLRYDGDYGPLSVGVSIHYSQDANDELYAAALSYDVTPNITPFIGFETASDLGLGGKTGYVLGADLTYGAFSGQIAFNQNAGFDPDRQRISLNGAYQVNEALEAGFSYLAVKNTGSTNSIYGIGAQYDFNFGGFARSDIMKDFSGGDPIISVEIGYTF